MTESQTLIPKSKSRRGTVINSSFLNKRQSSLPQLHSARETGQAGIILGNDRTYLLSYEKKDIIEKGIKMPKLRFKSRNIKDESEQYKNKFIKEWDSLQGEMYKQEVRQNMISHQPSININKKQQAYSPYMEKLNRIEENDSRTSISSRDSQLIQLKSARVVNGKEQQILSQREKQQQECEINKPIFSNIRDRTTYHQRVTNHEYEVNEYMVKNIQKVKEKIKTSLNSFPQKNMSEHIEEYQKAEDNAAKIYIDFQKHYVRLNSMVKTNGEGIVMLEDGLPGYFDLQEGYTAHFMFHNDSDKNPKGAIKMQVNKLYGKVVVYLSEMARKPTRQTAKVIIDQNKAKYQQDMANKGKQDMIFFTVYAKSQTKGTFTARFYKPQQKQLSVYHDEPVDRMSLFFSDKKHSMQDIIADLKSNSQKRSNFLEKLNTAISQHSNKLYNFQQKNFIRTNRDVSPNQQVQQQKSDYFNMLKERQVLAQQRKDINEKSQQQMMILKQNRKLIKDNVQREVVSILQSRQQQKQFLKIWTALALTAQGLKKLKVRYNKFKAIYIRDVMQYFMARKIQRKWRRFLQRKNRGNHSSHSMRNIMLKYVQNTMKLTNETIKVPTERRAKQIIFSFYYYNLASMDLINKMKRFHEIAWRMKVRFEQIINRRRHKFKVMNEYWSIVVDSCYLVKMGKGSSIIEKFNGDQFYKISDQEKIKAIKDYLRQKEREYADQTVEFFNTFKKITDVKLKIASQSLFYLQQFQIMRRSGVQEVKKLQLAVSNALMQNISSSTKGSKTKKNQNLLNQLRRQSLIYMEKADIQAQFLQIPVSQKQQEADNSVSSDEASPKSPSKSPISPRKNSKGKVGKSPKKKKKNKESSDLTPQSFEQAVIKVEDFDDVIRQCKVSGLAAPSLEYIPDFNEMFEAEPLEAILLSFGFGSLFVLSLYMWTLFEKKKPAQLYNENSNEEILKRITSVVIFSILVVCFINIKANHLIREDVSLLDWFGLSLSEKTPLAIANALTLNSLLFLGEIAQIFTGMREIDYDEISLLNFKNLVLVPFFEEFIYRACIINILVEANVMSLNKCVMISPLFFAIAHGHHLYRQRHLPPDQFKKAIFGKIFQFCFTTIFGIYAGYAYVYTGQLWAAIALHAQCNFFGFPMFQNLFDDEFSTQKRMLVGYIYLIGIVMFYNFFGFFFNPEFVSGIAIAILGSGLRLFAILGGYNGSFWILGVGHSFIGIAVILILICSINIVYRSSSDKRKWYLSCVTGSVPLGLLLAILLYQIIFEKRDQFFTNVDKAQAKIEVYMAVQTFLLIVVGIWSIILYKKLNLFHTQNQRGEFKAQLKTFCKSRFIMMLAIGFGFANAAFFLQLQKWPHIVNQFGFTQSDSELFMTEYVFGCLVSSTLFIHVCSLYDRKPKITILLIFIGFSGFLGTIMGTFLEANVGLTSFIAFGIGFFLYTIINFIFYQLMNLLQKHSLDKLKSQAFAVLFMLGGTLAAVMTGVGDKIHYQNRDIKTWIYAAEGFVGFGITVTTILLLISTRY